MPGGPIEEFGWLLRSCISDEARRPGLVLSAAAFFTAGILSSGITLYLVGALHII